jgi:predicted MFS family arabinose efflux permease
VVPLFSLRLKELGFSATEIGWCCATQAIGTLLAPLVAGQIADRWLAAERCLGLCALISAALLWLLAGLTAPAAVFGVNLLLWLVMAPALTLSTSVCFAHLRDARRDFGKIRMWGTLGWVVPGWLLGFWLADGERWRPLLNWLRPDRPLPELADAFRLAALLAAGFAVYALTLPCSPLRRGIRTAAPLAALRLFHGREFLIYAVCTFGLTAVLPFSTQVTPLLLEQLGVSRPWLPRLLTVAQASEVISLLFLPRLLSALGLRGAMRLGLAAAVLTLGSLALGSPLSLALAGLTLYGLCISCYLVAGQMYLNQRSRDDVRASAQALHSTLCGLGMLVGNVLVGEVRARVNGAFAPTFAIGAALSLLLLAIFVCTFPIDRAARRG